MITTRLHGHDINVIEQRYFFPLENIVRFNSSCSRTRIFCQLDIEQQPGHRKNVKRQKLEPF